MCKYEVAMQMLYKGRRGCAPRWRANKPAAAGNATLRGPLADLIPHPAKLLLALPISSACVLTTSNITTLDVGKGVHPHGDL